MEPPSSEPFKQLLTVFEPLSFSAVWALLLMVLLLFLSALFSGSEVAYFSLTPTDEKELEDSESKKAHRVRSLLSAPRRLLATILIANNFVNVAIIIISTMITESFFGSSVPDWVRFTVQVVAVTFLIVLVGEVMPKVYANRYALRLAGIMSAPLMSLRWLFRPLSEVLVRSTSMIDKRIRERMKTISVDELGQALELTRDENTIQEDHRILQGIVKFGNTDVKQIMTPRTDIVAFPIDIEYEELLAGIIDSGFSRIPIYEESFDKIKGIMYIKDIIPLLDKSGTPDLQHLLRESFFVPENKMIDDLLADFQEMKMHMAIVVDEYGGTSGIVTLEDVLEEIVGEITDEFDDEESVYSKLDDRTYIFEGKIALNDMYRILDIDGTPFEKTKGGSDTLAGFIVEHEARIPTRNEEIGFENYRFVIESADQRRIKRVKVRIEEVEDDVEE